MMPRASKGSEMRLYEVTSQQWFDLDSVVTVDDYGWDVGVEIANGRQYRIHGSSRDAFYSALQAKPATISMPWGVQVEV